ncbi:MAG: ethanolamine ammonia-lyase subunit EutC [Synergistaceae bacterium]|nr:ethanolamine ammonia-lyase subunit EutC [Synergistaceae bacterium]
MIEQNALREIIEQVLGEMNVSGMNAAPKTAQTGVAAPSTSGSVAVATKTTIDDGFIPDVTDVDIRKQYLVENPVNGPAYAELKLHAPCRLAIGKAGARYKTDPMLQFRAAHSAAQDAVFSAVDTAFLEKMGFFTIQTMCDNKDIFLTRPDLGRRLNEEAIKTLNEKCTKNPKVQIYVSDGLSSAAVAANVADVYPSLVQGLKSYGIEVGTPFFLEYGRVGAMDQITELLGAEVTCVLIGERPGLITAESMSAYMTYKGTVGMPEARRNVISNIHKDGTPPVEAGAHIAEVLKSMLDQKTSGTELVKA